MRLLTWRILAAGLLISGLAPNLALAGDVEILKVTIAAQGERTYRFDVTVRHGDTGWDHYADAWEVLAPDGTSLGLRTLYHPHVEEQPFTRSLGSVRIPPEITTVRIRARDSVHGWSPDEASVAVPQ
ncbi:MAG: hypothetical protein ACPGOY_17325 [Rhodospirillaceae bacterium]